MKKKLPKKRKERLKERLGTLKVEIYDLENNLIETEEMLRKLKNKKYYLEKEIEGFVYLKTIKATDLRSLRPYWKMQEKGNAVFETLSNRDAFRIYVKKYLK